jgi:hypothetical protein
MVYNHFDRKSGWQVDASTRPMPLDARSIEMHLDQKFSAQPPAT